MLDQARAAAVAGDSLHAADLFQQAMQKQRDLIRDFPESRFADAALLDSVEIERQTALSHPVAGEIEHQADALAQDLRQQNFAEARENAAGLDQKITAFHQTYPRSTLLAGEVEQRVAYLDFKRNDFENLQKQVYDQLLALPGQTRFALYKQEVPQSLYLAVAGDNPSRNVGPALPVDSVNWNSARDFCRHLEWLLGRPVRLPTIEEFRAAAGPATAAGSAPANWNMDNSGGHTQPVATSAPNAAGYYDLLGNVGEWLERPASELDGQAPVAGGNALSPSDVLRDVPVDHVSILDQGKYTGFRFVVDLDAQAPLTTPPPAAADTIPAAPAASGSHAKDAP
jgi:hypothetical protein